MSKVNPQLKAKREEYKEVFDGKNPFNGWSLDELQEKIDAELAIDDDPVVSPAEPVEEEEAEELEEAPAPKKKDDCTYEEAPVVEDEPAPVVAPQLSDKLVYIFSSKAKNSPFYPLDLNKNYTKAELDKMDVTTKTRAVYDTGEFVSCYMPLQGKEAPGTLHSVMVNGAYWNVPKGKQNIMVPVEVAKMVEARIDSERIVKEDFTTDDGQRVRNLNAGDLDEKLENALY